MSVIVGFLSIFRRDIGKRWWKTFKKSWGCVGKRVTLQKCETGFKDDIKNSILSKVIVKKPKLVKPISVGIEVASVLIVLITVWSLVEGAKAGLALWSLGTCNVQRPEACSLGAEVCSIDGDSGPQNPIEAIGYWFSDWGEIFGAIPDKFRDWDNEELNFDGLLVKDIEGKRAIDIFDPGCSVCLQSYRAQKESGFFEKNKVLLVPFPIQDAEGKFKFANSKMIVGYIFATRDIEKPENYKLELDPSIAIIDRIFTEKNDEGKNYQTLFNDYYSKEQAEEELQAWLKEFGYNDEQIKEIAEKSRSEEVEKKISNNNDIVVNNIHAKGIPTMIYNGKKHTGLYKEND
ncbi:MAG: hypothetical protein MJ154_03640 [Candidatus Saccharibacteria bacterium]|nr:hypothetical protein [Candidatus Saccharibacteria bacterium]